MSTDNIGPTPENPPVPGYTPSPEGVPPSPSFGAAPPPVPGYGQSGPAPAPTPSYGQMPPPFPATPPVPGAYPPVPYGAGGSPYGTPVEWQKRLVGGLIDWGSVFAISSIASWVSYSVGFLGTLLSLVAVAWGIYNIGYLGGTTGVSYGRKTAGIKLVSEQTLQPIGAGLGIARYFLHFIDAAICCVGFLFPLWTPKKQTIADMIIKTIVIDNK